MAIGENNRLHEDVIERVKALIASGQISPGQRFPAERALEESLAVSRPVLREAFRVLESWGWIESRRGSGRYLRELRGAPMTAPENPLVTIEQSALLDIWEAREVLEIKTAALAATRASDDDLRRLRELAASDAAMPADVAARRHADLEFHLAIAAATHNFALRDMVGYQMSLLRGMDQQRLLGSENWRMLCREHLAIADAVAARDADAAAGAMATHLGDLKRAIFQIR